MVVRKDLEDNDEESESRNELAFISRTGRNIAGRKVRTRLSKPSKANIL